MSTLTTPGLGPEKGVTVRRSQALVLEVLKHREKQFMEVLYSLQVADDNHYSYSAEGRSELRYLHHRKVVLRRSIERLTAWL